MRQPVRLPRPEQDTPRMPSPVHDEPHPAREARRPPRPRPRTSFTTDSSAIRAGLSVTAIVVVGILIYLVTLTSRPSVSSVSPAPNSEAPPGIVTIQAHVEAGRPIQQVTLWLNGNEARPAVQVNNSRSWSLRYQAELPRGTHEASVVVTDSSGEIEEHVWSFIAAGPQIQPAFMVSGPPADATIGPGMIRFRVEVLSAAEITATSLSVDGQAIPSTFRLIGAPGENTNENGRYHQQWEVIADGSVASGYHTAELEVTDRHGDTANVDWSFRVASNPAEVTVRYFADTNQYAQGPFKEFWEEHDGAALFGSPVSPEVTDQDGQTMQYFEYARMEQTENGDIALGLLGRELMPQPSEPVEKPDDDSIRFFEETGHTLGGLFRKFWEDNGELPMFGFPISEVIEEGGIRVQYFERARFELRYGETDSEAKVHLTPLGRQAWEKGPLDNRVN